MVDNARHCQHIWWVFHLDKPKAHSLQRDGHCHQKKYQRNLHQWDSFDSIVVDHTDQPGTVVERIPNCDVVDSGHSRCTDVGGNGSGHTADVHKDVEGGNAVHAFHGVRMGHCNQPYSNERLCLLPSFCWESYCVQEVVSTAIEKMIRAEEALCEHRRRIEYNKANEHCITYIAVLCIII